MVDISVIYINTYIKDINMCVSFRVTKNTDEITYACPNLSSSILVKSFLQYTISIGNSI